jgi:hypothetical protein
VLVESFSLNASKFNQDDSEVGRNLSTGILDCLAAILQVYQHAKDFFPLAFVEVVIQ